MTPELFQEITRRGGCTDLSARAKFMLTGADAVRYLNGQVTNDVRKAAPDAAIHACVTNAKGRIEGDVFIHRTADGLLLDAEAGLRETLRARLEKYIVADDVALLDVTDEWRLVHFFGKAQDAAREVKVAGSPVVKATRFGEDGLDLWLPASQILPPAAPGALLSDDEIETLRIIRGIPRWPEELNLEAFPQEAGLENSAMDFSKGCYIGQEVLSRIKTTGKMPRTLVRFRVQRSEFMVDDNGLARNPKTWRLFTRASDGSLKAAGAVMSVCAHPELDRMVGLAYVRQGLEQEHSLLLATEDPPNIFAETVISVP